MTYLRRVLKDNFQTLVFYFLFFCIFITEALGIPNLRLATIHIIIASPFVFFLIERKKMLLRTPIIAGFFLTLFLITVSMSTFRAIHIQTAFEHQLFYIAIVLWFIYIFNHQDEILKGMIPFIVVCTVMIIGYSIFLMSFRESVPFLIPLNGYQLIYRLPQFAHHPLGAFLLIPLVQSIIQTVNTRKPFYIFLTSILFTLLIFSYMRAAYVAFTVVLIVLIFKKNYAFLQKGRWLLFFVLLCVCFFFFVTTLYPVDIPILTPLNHFLVQHAGLDPKFLSNGRNEYIIIAIQAIIARPLLGVGSYGFYFASLQYAPVMEFVTDSSQNIFLDIAVENGVLAALFIGSFIMYALWYAFQNNTKRMSVEYIALLISVALLVLFQFNYYHRLYFILLFFFFCLGLVYKEKTVIYDSQKILTIIAVFLCMMSIIIGVSKIVVWGKNYTLAHNIYPLLYDPYLFELSSSAQSVKQQEIINKFFKYYGQNHHALSTLGTILYRENPKVALHYFLLALNRYPSNTNLAQVIHEAIYETYGKKSADTFIYSYLHSSGVSNYSYVPSVKMFIDWCTTKHVRCL